MTELERRQQELVRDREKYEKAKVETRNFNPDIVMDMYNTVAKYNPGDDPNKAIWTLAQLSLMINSVAEPFKVVAEYERKKDAIKKASGG